MSVIIRLQNLPWSASALDIRQFFKGLSIPAGGVHIIGGEKGDAFIAFASDEDARQAMMRNMNPLSGTPIQLFLSSKSEMQAIIEEARAADSGGVPAVGVGVAAASTQQMTGIQAQGLSVPLSSVSQHLPQHGQDTQSQFLGTQGFAGASLMQGAVGRDSQYAFPGDKSQAMSQPSFSGAGISQDQTGISSQYGFPTDRNQASMAGRFKSSQADAGNYAAGYAGNDGQQWPDMGQGQGQDFQMNQQYYGDEQSQARTVQQKPDQFIGGTSGRDGQFTNRQGQQPFAKQGGEPIRRRDPLGFGQPRSMMDPDEVQQGPEAGGRFPMRPGRPEQSEMGKPLPHRPGMPGYVDEQAPGRKLDIPGPRPFMGMRLDQQGPMRPDQQGPMRPDRPGLLRPDQPGPVQHERGEPLHPDRPDLMRSVRPDPTRPDRFDPLRQDRPDAVRPDRFDPRPERSDPSRPARPELMRPDRSDPLTRPEHPLPDQRPMRPEQQGLLEPRPGVMRGPAVGRPSGLLDDHRPTPGMQPDLMGRPRGRGMLPTPEMPPLNLASFAEESFADEDAMEHGRWPGYGDEETAARERGVDDRSMKNDPDFRRPEPDMNRGRGPFQEGGDSDFRGVPRPGVRPFDGPEGRRPDGPGGRPFDHERRFEGAIGRFDERRGYEDSRRFEDAPERHFEDQMKFEDDHMREIGPQEREFDRHTHDFEGHAAGRGFPGLRGRGFPGRRGEGPRGRGFGSRGRGFVDYGAHGQNEFEHQAPPEEYQPYPVEEDNGQYEGMQTEEFGDDVRGRPYPPFQREFDDRPEGGRGRVEVGRGRIELGRGRLEPGRGKMDIGRGRFDGLGAVGHGMDIDRRWATPNRQEANMLDMEQDRNWRDNAIEPHSRPGLLGSAPTGLLGDAPPGLLPVRDIKPDENRQTRDRDSDSLRDRDRRRERDDRDKGRDDRRRSDRRGRSSRSSDRPSHRGDRDRDRDNRRDKDRDRNRFGDRDRDRSSTRDRHSKDRSAKDGPIVKKDEKSETDKSTDDTKIGIPGKFIYVKNFPPHFNYKDICRFFNGCELPPDGVKTISNTSGERTGEVYLKFASEEIAKRAMKVNGEKLQGTAISLSYATAKDFEEHVDSQRPPEGSTPSSTETENRGLPAVIRRSDKNSHIVQVRGLPFTVKKEDLKRFFSTVKIAENGAAIYIECDNLGQGTGVAYMEVETMLDFRTAMGYDGRLFGPRAVKLSAGRREDFDLLVKKQQEMCSRQSDQQRLDVDGLGLGPGQTGQRPPLLPQGPGGGVARPQPPPLMSLGLLGPGPRNGPALLQNPPTQQQSQNGDKPQGAPGGQVHSPDLCVHIQGLPMLATHRDIRDFFSDLEIVQRGIQIVHDGVGKPMGEGFVEFATPEDKEKALRKDKTSMGRHIVAVKHIAKADMVERLRNARLVGLPPGQAALGGPLPPIAPAASDARPKAIPPGVLNRQWTYLRCQNFPNNIGVSEIMSFFKGYRPVGESIRLHFLADGIPTGNAVVGFPTKEDAAQAMQELNGKLCRQSQVLLQPAV